jgi:hypothetical protein
MTSVKQLEDLLASPDGKQALGMCMHQAIHENMLKNREKERVDAVSSLKAIAKPHCEFFLFPPLPHREKVIRTRFNVLAALRDGWLDGQGVAANPVALTTVREKMVYWPLEIPTITLTPEGNVYVEWGVMASIEIDLTTGVARYSDDTTGLSFDLKEKDGWGRLFTHITE